MRLEIQNACSSKKIDYCVEDGSTLFTTLNWNTTTSHTVKPGARVRLRKASSTCADTLYTVTDSKAEQKFVICK